MADNDTATAAATTSTNTNNDPDDDGSLSHVHSNGSSEPLPPAPPPFRQVLHPAGRQSQVARQRKYEEEVKRIAVGHSHKFTADELAAMRKEDRFLVTWWPEDWEAQLARRDWVFFLPAVGASHALRRALAVAARFTSDPEELKEILERSWAAKVAGKPKRQLDPQHVKVAVSAWQKKGWAEISRDGLKME
ncbi:hypothetical protein MBLNU230_g8457t1 [Neophaeotheca triangularis]